MGYTYEERLRQSLSIEGYLTYIIGPSKIGKTVLCENVIGADNMICMSGNDFVKERDFWSGIGKKAGISMEAEISERSGVFSENENKATTITKNYTGNKDKILRYFKETGKVLVLDDFHYAPEEIQYDIACQLKEVIRLGFKAVVISLPYRSDDAIRLNPDLTGRISVIEMEPWTDKELQMIAQKGFMELGISVSSELMERMAMESIHSPQMMQAVCLNIGLLPLNFSEITNQIIEESCRFTCANLPYADVVRILKSGPPTRGQQRLKYDMKDGSKRDIYSVILKILADNPPLIELNLNELTERILNNVQNAKITTRKLRDSLKNWQKLIEEQGALYQVFEWKDDKLHISDNLFLFYIRWSEV
ncbi:MAG: ATP-binding protein [Blautia sp.]|nr:ATP-binding protein [Blautia sp.]